MKPWPLIGLLATIAYADYPSYEMESRGVVYDGALASAQPCVTRAANNNLLVQFNTTTDGWPGGKSYMVRSSDEGQTWSTPYLIAESTIANATITTDIGLTTLSNGDIMFAFSHIKIKDGYSGYPNLYHPGDAWVYPYVIISTDNGKTFGPWIKAPGLNENFGSPFGRIVEMPDHTLYLPMWFRYGWGDTYSLNWGRSGYAISHDMGRSWDGFQDVGPYGETNIILAQDRKTLYGVGKRNGAPVFTRFFSSTDGGKTWPENDTTYFQGGKNASLHISPNGFLLSLLNFGIPDKALHRGRIIFSLDNGSRWWDGFSIFPILEQGGVGFYGYGVSALNLPNNRIMLLWYSEDPNKAKSTNSPFEPTNAYVGYTIVKETIHPGDPPYAAITDAPQQIALPLNNTDTTTTSHAYAYPCPWRGDRHSSVPIQFSNIPIGSTVKIYTISAHLVASVPEVNGKARWDLTNFSGERVASGIYLFSANQMTGKFAIIR